MPDVNDVSLSKEYEDRIAQLERENRRMQRQLKNYQEVQERAQSFAMGKSTVDNMMENERKRQEKYMRLLLENSPDIILLFDQSGRFTYCTDSFLNKADIRSFSQINGRHYRDVFAQYCPSADQQLVDRVFEQELVGDETRTTTATYDIGGRGNPRHYEIHFTPMVDERGNAEGSIVLMHDITDLLHAKEQAEQASLSKSNFLSSMSHEMRTPMNAIIGMSSIAKNTQDLTKMRYCMDKIDNASVHLLGVINDILDMSKIESGKFEISVAPFPFEKMLMKVVSVQNFRIDERKQDFFVKIDDEIPRTIVADEQRLSQVIANLLSNAVKFTPEGGRIVLDARKIDEDDGRVKLEISVTDTGIGVTPEQQERLFRSFEQADSGVSRKFGGTGLGLAISKNIVGMMQGEIWVESEASKGSRFAFTAWVDKGEDAVRPVEGFDPLRWQKLHVLAVDDSEDVLEYFKSIGTSLGLQCDVASSGAQALTLIGSTTPYEIIFVDWMMPEMDGIELTRRIKERCGESAIVVMISAAEWKRIEADATQAGVDRFMAKPLFVSDVAECIAECMHMEQSKPIEPEPTANNVGIFAGKRIMLVEDVEINREIVIELLSETGVGIECAENGAQACEMFEDAPERYDLILMDVHMPVVDGYEATRRIRAIDVARATQVPIIAMTANVFREDVENCLQAGMNDHLGKPIDMDSMMHKLRMYLLRGGNA